MLHGLKAMNDSLQGKPFNHKPAPDILGEILRLLLAECVRIIEERGPEIMDWLDGFLSGGGAKKWHNSHWCTDCGTENLPNPIDIFYVWKDGKRDGPISRSLCPKCGYRRKHDPPGTIIEHNGKEVL